MKTGLAAAAAAIVLALGTVLPLPPAHADKWHLTTHSKHGYGYYKMSNLRLCLRIDTGVNRGAHDPSYAHPGEIRGDELVGMTVVYHNADGNWQHWLNDSTKDTLWKDNTANDQTRYAWNCSPVFKEAWVRKGHEAMHAYVGVSKTGNRWTRSPYADPPSHPYEVNMVDHWEVHHQSDDTFNLGSGVAHGHSEGAVTHWCFVAGYKKKYRASTLGYIAKWWLHLKAVTGSTNCSGI